MSEYKLSRYNVFINDKFLWNTFSDALLVITPEEKQAIESGACLQGNSDLFNGLLQNGCIVNSSLDELGKILADEKASMLNVSPKHMGFTIAPGLGCNYRCEYCFEKDNYSDSKMDKDTIDDVLKYIFFKVNENATVQSCHITWFGGEPLLYLDIIEYLSKKIISFCNNKGISYTSGIITNGRFLTESTCRALKDLLVSYAQITIDGLPDSYSKIKHSKIEDFWAVVKNIQYAQNYLRINIRINANPKTDIKEIYELVDLLLKRSNLDNKVKIYIGFLRDYNSSSKVERQAHRAHLQFETKLIKYLDKFYSGRNYGVPYPKRRIMSCLQMCVANACIGPQGELYRCEHYFGDSSAIIGNVKTGLYYNQADRKFYNFKHLSKCLKCVFSLLA